MPKISVIVPVYNVEKYILQCLESIAAQTFRDFEVIIVNDGTQDKSAQIAETFICERNLKNFRIIHKENGGLCSARNAGLELATGEWINFVDSDDYMGEDYLSNMIQGLEKFPADYCMAGYKKYYENTHVLRSSVITEFAYGNLSDVLENLYYISPFAKLYSARIIRENGLRFDERIAVGEDRAFIYDYLCCVEKCVVIEDDSYIYRIREGSITNQKVKPQQKKFLYEHARNFWLSFEDENIICETFRNNHHFAHNILDSFLADVIVAVLENNHKLFRKLTTDRISVQILNYYGHKEAPRKEKLLVALLKNKHIFLCKLIIRLYYNETMNRILKPIVKAWG